jgi:hypothetical protein
LGEATGIEGEGGTAGADGEAGDAATEVTPAEGELGEVVCVGFATGALNVGKLQAKINIETINKTRIRRLFIVPPFGYQALSYLE